jgi:hypothetical protein
MKTLPFVRQGAWWAGLLVLSTQAFAQDAPPPPLPTDTVQLSGEWRTWHQALGANSLGPLAWAHALQPGLIPLPVDTTTAEAELRARWRFIQGNVLLSWSQPERGVSQTHSQVQELYANAEAGDWQFSAGRKVVSWDVGYGFRPNDIVQHETRRSLLTVTPQGRPMLQAETFGADSATSLVWVNPQAHHDAAPATEADEAALAARWYHRSGSRDDYLFARWGQYSHASIGAALAWVATDELELHASARWHQQGGDTSWLLGANWTGTQQQGLMLEWWHDASAPDNATWTPWLNHNQALRRAASTPVLPEPLRMGLAAQLAQQATLLRSGQLRQDNLFVRTSWQHEAWQFEWDTLYMPADHGQIGTLSAQWQADQWRLTLAWRRYGGPSTAVSSQLPSRQTLLLAAVVAF